MQMIKRCENNETIRYGNKHMVVFTFQFHTRPKQNDLNFVQGISLCKLVYFDKLSMKFVPKSQTECTVKHLI